MKALKFLSLFIIAFAVIIAGCSKHITGPEEEKEVKYNVLIINGSFQGGLDSLSVEEGTLLDIYANALRSGWYFTGWAAGKTENTNEYVDNLINADQMEACFLTPAHDVVIKAHYAEDEQGVAPVPDSLIYIEGGGKTSKGDTLIVQGTKIFEHYGVVVLNGSDGPIRHIDMCTGWDYKNNKQFTVIRDCCADVMKIPLNQFAHMYDHVTLQVGTDPEETSDWSYYGRFDIHIGLRGIVEIPSQDQWWDMLRIL